MTGAARIETQAVPYSPKSFVGDCHIVRARLAARQEIAARRNLAFNPYDAHGDTGFYPHGVWPYQSWGINRDPDAAPTLSFGRSVTIDEIRLTLRADFPHDSWWTEAAVRFDDGSNEILSLTKTAGRQAFAIPPRTVTSMTLCGLKKADDPSPFPALTQIEVWGTETRDMN